MSTRLNLLVVEDSEDDALLLIRELERAGYVLSYRRVETAAAFQEALDEQQWDVIFSDYSQPHFSGMAALEIVKQRGLDLPFLVISGTVGEEAAVEALKAGAHDFFVKSNMARLGPALARELRETEERRRRRETEAALREHEERLSLAVNAAGMGIWNRDLRTEQVVVGGHFEQLFGLETDTFGGTYEDFLKLIHHADREMVEQAIEEALDQTGFQVEFRTIRANGDVRWIIQQGRVYCNWRGQAVRVAGVLQDITDRKRSEELLRQQALELEAQNQELDAFAHTVSHDLKNPVASMLGFATLIRQYHDRMSDEEVLENIDEIIQSGYQIRRIIDGLLLLSQAHRAESITLTDVDISEIVNSALQSVAQMIEESDAEIVVPAEWPRIRGYAPWIEEVWTNYISNAIKYGGRPPRVELGASQDSNGSMRFWVRDNGPGLTEEERQKVFVPFTRLSQAKIEGHGLGLSIVQRIVGKLGGEVSVESTPGEGCVFSFTLPIEGAN